MRREALKVAQKASIWEGMGCLKRIMNSVEALDLKSSDNCHEAFERLTFGSL